MKFDVDYIKNVIMQDKPVTGNSSRLTAFKRASTVVDTTVDGYQSSFKGHLKMLRHIAIRARGKRLIALCLHISQSTFISQYLIPAVILGNTAVLSLDSYPEDPRKNTILEYLNLSFYFVFLSEILVKFIALGFKAFMTDSYNIFDSVLVAISSIDTVILLMVLIRSNELSLTNSGALH